MKIAAVSIYPARGEKHTKASGVASYTKNLLKHLPLRDHDELYVICNKLHKQREEYREDGFTIMRVFDRNFRFVWQIYRAITAIDADVIHIQQEIPLYGRAHTAYMLQWLVWLLRQRKVVVTLHHVVSLKRVTKQFVRSNNSSLPAWAVKLAFFTIYRPLVKWADEVVVHEPTFKETLVAEYGASPDKVTAIPHGVEDFAPRPMATARRQLAIKNDRHVVFFMGYLAGYKGFDLLLEGFSKYAVQDPKALLLIGAGKHPKLEHDAAYRSFYAATQRKAHRLLSEHQYRWVGFVQEADIAAYYSASNVSLYPYIISMSSSGPMAIAIGYEQAFLASDVFSTVLPHDLLFARTPEAVADKLADFFARPQHYIHLSRSLKNNRLWSTVGEHTRDVYRTTAKPNIILHPEEEPYE